MAATTNTTTAAATPAMGSPSADELTAKAANKRYEGLVMVRAKAMKGKGAWYWTHLEPMLVHNTETGLPKAVKLRCSLCDAVFSASNPSRTATEHLKRGTCPNFNSLAKPISSISPTSPVLSSSLPSSSVHHHRRQNHRKRTSSSSATRTTITMPYQVQPLAVVNPSRFHSGGDHLPTSATSSAAATPTSLLTARQHQQHLMLSGGKDDLGALAMLEDSVKKLKSPKTSQAPTLSKSQIQNAIDYLADWVYENNGSVSFSSLEHPKFKSFLNQVGLPEIPRTELTGTRLDSKYKELKAECESRIRDAMFFQIASDGWKVNNYSNNNLTNYEENVVNLSLNLPNGTSLYRKAVFFTGSSCSSKYAEEVLWETITGINGSVPQQCVGIVADKFKSKALKNLENQNHWMVNLSCQFQGFISLIKDFNKDLHLFKNVTTNCVKLANFVNQKSQIRNSFHKYQIQEYGHAWLLRSPPLPSPSRSDFSKDFNLRLVYVMMEDVLSSTRALQSILLDESFKLSSMEDENVREVENMIRDPGFWNELEAMYSLVKLVKDMAHEIEIERPLVGQCLLLWEELRARVKNWSSKFPNIGEKESINNAIERRFHKNYHPAWSAAYILDPLYLVPDTNGKFIPPFKCMTPEQEKDVNNLITRLVYGDEAHIALMELTKWKTEGLDPVYARAVQMKERDPITGKMRIANPQSSRLVWETYLTEFKSLGRIAVRLIFLHATCCGIKCENSSMLRRICGHGRRSQIGLDRAQKIMFIAAHSKLERRDFSSDEDKEVEVLLSEDDVLNEIFVDTSSV